MTWSRWRRKGHHQPPAQVPPTPPEPTPPPVEAAPPPPPEPWQPVAAQFASRVLMLAWSAGSHLAEVEDAEQDANQLQRLYRTDHALTRIRRAAENLQVLAGVRIEDPGRQIASLLDVVRAAASAVEHYDRVQVGRIADLAVAEVAADDAIRILTELIDNAVKFSPPAAPVTVSAHLTEAGHVLVRVEDGGIGIHPTQLPRLNAMLDGPGAPSVDDQQASRLGLLVVACIARTHRSLRVQLSPRQPAGTVAMLLVGAELVCEIPDNAPAARPATPHPAPDAAPPVRLHAVRSPALLPRRSVTPAANGTDPDDVGGTHRTADPTVELPTRPAGAAAPLPRRVPGSVRIPGEPGPPAAAVATHERTWHDDAADFAAGIDEART